MSEPPSPAPDPEPGRLPQPPTAAAASGGTARVQGKGFPRRPRRRWLRHLLALTLVLIVLMVIPTEGDPPAAPITADRLVVVGVGERAQLEPVDASVLDERAADASYGVVATDREDGECVSAAWLSLGADGRALTQDICRPAVTVTQAPEGDPAPATVQVEDWEELRALNEERGTAIGLLPTGRAGLDQEPAAPTQTAPHEAGQAADRCIAAVGERAALGAADPRGHVAHYRDLDRWADQGHPTDCEVTLVDAEERADEVIAEFAHRPVTLLVVGMGPDGPLETDSIGVRQTHDTQKTSVQLAYRIDPPGSDDPSGALSSTTTAEPGVITLHDVARAITAKLDPAGNEVPLRVVPGAVSSQTVADHLADISRLEHRSPIMLAFGAGMVTLLAVSAVMVWRRAWALAPWIGAALTTWPIALLSGGIVAWYASDHAVLAGIGTVGAAWLLATVAARALTTHRRPAAIAGTALTLAMTSFSAARGDLWQWGTLLDSTTALGPDWIGIGPGAGAACVGAALTIAAWWADRMRPRESLIAIGVLVIVLGAALLPNFAYSIALAAGGVVLGLVATARRFVQEAVPWADPLFVGGAVASLVAALVGTALLLMDSGTILLHMAPETPLFGGILMAWLGSVTLALWLQLSASRGVARPPLSDALP